MILNDGNFHNRSSGLRRYLQKNGLDRRRNIDWPGYTETSYCYMKKLIEQMCLVRYVLSLSINQMHCDSSTTAHHQ